MLDPWIQSLTPDKPKSTETDTFHAIRAREMALTLPKWATPDASALTKGFVFSLQCVHKADKDVEVKYREHGR